MLKDDQSLLQDGNKKVKSSFNISDRSSKVGELKAKIKNVTNAGFQFKLFAECKSSLEVDNVVKILEEFFGEKYKESVNIKNNLKINSDKKSLYCKENLEFALVNKASQAECEVWFILPQYRVVVTPDKEHPYLNNYYDVNDRG